MHFTHNPAKARDNYWRFFVFIIYICLGLFISRYSLFEPCLTDEEAFYFEYAYEHAPHKALITPHYGYYNFWAVAATTAASHAAPLEYAPFVTMLFGIAGWALIGMLGIMPGGPFVTPLHSALALLLILIFSPMWFRLSTHTAHFNFGVMALIILLSTPTAGFFKWFQRLILIMSGLSGTLSIFLVPAFWYRAYLWRGSSERLIQALLLSTCAVLQLAVFLFGLSALEHQASRGLSFPFDTFLAATFNQVILGPFLDLSSLQETGSIIKGYIFSSDAVQYFGALGAMMIAILLTSLLILGKGDMSDVMKIRGRIMLFAFFTLVFISFLSGSDSTGDANKTYLIDGHLRYAYIPKLLLGFAALGYVFHVESSSAQRIFYTVLIMLFISGSIFHYISRKMNASSWVISCPQWSEQVDNWKSDSSMPLTGYPHTTSIQLNPRE